jgi:signal transduction histidine kinase
MRNRYTIFKFGLFLSALFLSILLYRAVQGLTLSIKEQEMGKIMLWSQALENKSMVLSETKKLFDRITSDEKLRVELWSDAMAHLMSNRPDCNINLLVKVVSSNRNIPVILLNSDNKIISAMNISFKLPADSIATDSIMQKFSVHKPIAVNLSNIGEHYLHYTDSRLYTQLQFIFDEFVESMLHDIVENSVSVPVIITDSLRSRVLFSGNINLSGTPDSMSLNSYIRAMERENNPVKIQLYGNEQAWVFYKDSYLLVLLKYFPWASSLILMLFVTSSFLAFNASRKHDNNLIWVGMSKETAHQLGTPISSLMAWAELLRADDKYADMASEIDKDVSRLSVIADRFSKIGSEPKLKPMHITSVLEEAVSYMRRRTSGHIKFAVSATVPAGHSILINPQLFEWTIENLIRNAVDAMGGQGMLSIEMGLSPKGRVYIDIADTGKGIPRRLQKRIFAAGYSTKTRGWGLGLTLCKRIIEDYHKGKIFVKKSEIGSGTTFRILFPK